MHLKRAIRMFFVAAALAAPVACGIDLLATGEDSSTADSGAEASVNLPDGAVSDAYEEGTQYLIPPTPDPLLDAGLDVNNDNCLALCPEAGASCDAGWCVFDCSTNGSCNGGVVCPPGIPCEANCTGDHSCHEGVDCTGGSACKVHCTGDTSCDDKPVQCAGVGCSLDCSGNHACEKGAGCDASTCAINCTGHNSCNSFTQCTGDSCTIRCGAMGSDYNNESVCGRSVSCDATKLCDIGCVGGHTCRLETLSARSPGTASIECTGGGTCNHGLFVSGGDASVLCTGGGGDTCQGEVDCDAGSCTSTCSNDKDIDIKVCCLAPNPTLNCHASAKDGCKVTPLDCGP